MITQINLSARVILMFVCLGFGYMPSTLAKGPDARAVPVVVKSVIEQQLAPSIHVPGTIVSQQTAKVPAEIAGRLDWVVEVGDSVKKNQIIARLDAALQHLEIKRIEATLQRENVRLTYLKKEVNRLQAMANADLTAKNLFDKTHSDYGVVESELAFVTAQLQFQQEILKRYTIKAPFSGVITERFARQGEWLRAADPVVSLSNPKALEVIARVPIAAMASLTVKDKIPLTLDDEKVMGRLKAIVPIGDLQSHLFEIRVDLRHGKWRAGQAVKVLVPIDNARAVLTISRDALVLRRSGTSVFRIDEDNKAERISVATGIASGELIEIIGDIKSGDQIVVRGSERLRPGQVVKILPDGQHL